MNRFISQLASITSIYTHNGTFHCDELLALALLRIAGCDAPIVRTRNVSAVLDNDTAIFIDLGMKCDFCRFFDHHQPDAPQRSEYYDRTNPPHTKHSAAGLLWSVLGPELALKYLPNRPQEEKRFFQTVDRELILPVDYHDNGVDTPGQTCTLDLFTLVAACNSCSPPDSASQDATFASVLNAVTVLVKGYLEGTAVRINQENKIRNHFLAAAKANQLYVFLPRELSAPWRPLLCDDPDLWRQTLSLKAVVAPLASGGWALSTLPQPPKSRFSARCHIKAELKEVFPELTFVHPGGFYAVLDCLDRVDEIVRLLPFSQDAEQNDGQKGFA